MCIHFNQLLSCKVVVLTLVQARLGTSLTLWAPLKAVKSALTLLFVGGVCRLSLRPLQLSIQLRNLRPLCCMGWYVAHEGFIVSGWMQWPWRVLSQLFYSPSAICTCYFNCGCSLTLKEAAQDSAILILQPHNWTSSLHNLRLTDRSSPS